MYLKSIEVHGFKSFANKILFEFHNGITGIVGPNGSGKSNVADAVRWVLGEQSARTLRGISMQDVIFAGTETRKPLSYAYVAITMDNSDHSLPVEYEEVTIARRVYRSGESEYLLNGSPCRLKDVMEMLYDTGIGKEGYSIIGQGQIDRILSGRPEDRRELFDEAAGIVKYKRRKYAAEKKLEKERDNLVRVKDILTELEGRVGPLERQAEAARKYLAKKEQLKQIDINRFLVESGEIEEKLKELHKSKEIAEKDLHEGREALNRILKEYEEMETAIADMDQAIASTREAISNTGVQKEKLEGEINLLHEQIRTAETSDAHFEERQKTVNDQIKEKEAQKADYQKELQKLNAELSEMVQKRESAERELKKIQTEANQAQESIEKGKNEIIALLNTRSEILAKRERSDTMSEQVNLRRAELSARLLRQKTDVSAREEELHEKEKAAEAALLSIETAKQTVQEKEAHAKELTNQRHKAIEKVNGLKEEYNRIQSKYEALSNLSERYEGYGNSVRRVMEQKKRFPKLEGVVADLIRVEKKYETAIETALGGNIQNIVTEDEATAKEAIRFLKEQKAGRATFLPIESVRGRDMSKQERFLSEPGVIGFANTLVKADAVYSEVISYLLGRVFTVDTVDHALALARKSGYSLHIVTLEGEYLSPGGSIAGGAYRNNSNLLGRRRELEELEKKKAALTKELEEENRNIEALRTAEALAAEETEAARSSLQEAVLEENTVRLSLEQARAQWKEEEAAFARLNEERTTLEEHLSEIKKEQEAIAEELSASNDREVAIKKESEGFQKTLDQQMYLEEGAMRTVNELRMDESSFKQKTEFAQANFDRVAGEIAALTEEIRRLQDQRKLSKEEAKKKAADIEEIKKTILAAGEEEQRLKQVLEETIAKKEEISSQHKEFFTKRNDLSDRISNLDKELYRLGAQSEKLEHDQEGLANYIWNEYELTLHNAEKYRDPAMTDSAELRRESGKLREALRSMGNINVNAIEEYQEVFTRYTFLKTQHDDLIASEQTLLGVIRDLEEGMRRQFEEQFAVMQAEFDKAFKELFGGGKGTLTLQESEDILNSGILINAQPPGKKLQNMMQLSGGEKALTAIALLFAIQNMKPSPFCLLDEIEAALDDSNVGRFAKYLHKLTKNTQFIIITHRRGTMAAADRLYGITMQEKGVSALVSVNLIDEKLED